MRHWLGILFVALGLQAQEARIQILGTTDLHGHLVAQDTFTLQPANQGWAKVATLIRQQRALNPNTLLVDCGDTLQGEPVNYVRKLLRPDLLGSTEMRLRFEQEARAASAIGHPHIVEVTDLVEGGEHRRGPVFPGVSGAALPVNAIVMEVLDGQSLAQAMVPVTEWSWPTVT